MVYLNVCECIICCDHYIATSSFIKHIIVTIFRTSSWKKKPPSVDFTPYHCLMCDVTYKRSKQEDLRDVFIQYTKFSEASQKTVIFKNEFFLIMKYWILHSMHYFSSVCMVTYRVMHLHSGIWYFPHSKSQSLLQW
jgi:hypothetical protein